MNDTTTETTRPETYREMRQRHADEIGKFPMAFAFSDAQLEEAERELHADRAELVSLFAGAVVRRADVPAWEALEARHAAEMDAGLARYGFAFSAFCSSFADHETAYTNDAHDAMLALGIVRRRGQSWIEAIPGEETRRALLDACRECHVPRYAVGA